VNIHILQTTSDSSGVRHVRFTTDFGTTSARWVSDYVFPAPGGQYQVEFNIDTDIDLATNARLVLPGEPSLGEDGANVTLRALVEHADDDGVVFLRFATDAVSLVQTAGDIASGTTIEATLPRGSFSVWCIGVPSMWGARR
jgi:hypothetical protein